MGRPVAVLITAEFLNSQILSRPASSHPSRWIWALCHVALKELWSWVPTQDISLAAAFCSNSLCLWPGLWCLQSGYVPGTGQLVSLQEGKNLRARIVSNITEVSRAQGNVTVLTGAKFLRWDPGSSVPRAGTGAVNTHHLPSGLSPVLHLETRGDWSTWLRSHRSASQAQSRSDKWRLDRGTGKPSGTVNGLLLCKFPLSHYGLPFLGKDGLLDIGFLICIQTCCRYSYLVCIAKCFICILTHCCMLASE